MSEPTYRVELTHHPENGVGVEWRAAVYTASDYDPDSFNLSIYDAFRPTREEAFDTAQAWCKAKAQEPLTPSTVYLSEDGDLLDPHDGLRSVS